MESDSQMRMAMVEWMSPPVGNKVESFAFTSILGRLHLATNGRP